LTLGDETELKQSQVMKIADHNHQKKRKTASAADEEKHVIFSECSPSNL